MYKHKDCDHTGPREHRRRGLTQSMRGPEVGSESRDEQGLVRQWKEGEQGPGGEQGKHKQCCQSVTCKAGGGWKLSQSRGESRLWKV